jgi:hypothetical protein
MGPAPRRRIRDPCSLGPLVHPPSIPTPHPSGRGQVIDSGCLGGFGLARARRASRPSEFALKQARTAAGCGGTRHSFPLTFPPTPADTQACLSPSSRSNTGHGLPAVILHPKSPKRGHLPFFIAGWPVRNRRVCTQVLLLGPSPRRTSVKTRPPPAATQTLLLDGS